MFSEAKFLEIQKCARYETVRSHIINASYGKALYNIFILESENPNSTFLKHMKAHCWSGLLKHAYVHSLKNCVEKEYIDPLELLHLNGQFS